MPRLMELDPSWRRHEVGTASPNHGQKLPDGSIQWGGFEVDWLQRVDLFSEAQGIWFDCPLCWAAWKAGGKYGAHGVLVWFAGRGVPERLGKNSSGQTVRWNASGTGFEDLTLTPSILLPGGCNWHGFVTKGQVT